MLVGSAAALFAFIMLVERRLRPTSAQGEPPARLFSFKAAEVTNIQIRLTNQLLLWAERNVGSDAWSLTLPTFYPAQGPAIDWLLQAVEELAPAAFIRPAELSASGRTLADFGLDVPPATVTLLHGGKRVELAFGAKTPIGDQVYLQVPDRPGIHLVPAELFDRLPRSHHDWRDTMLFNSGPIGFSRLDVRGPGRGYTIEVINRQFQVTRPTVARADPAKVGRLLQFVRHAQVSQFITDNVRADPEPFGLQPPELEIVFGLGTNDLMTVQFGRSPTNDSSLVYARRLAQTNIVLTSREIYDAFQTTFNELRDLHLVSIPPGGVDSIEVIGTENFLVRRQTNGTWTIGDNAAAPAVAADTAVVREWIDLLAKLEGTVEKDVVTDFKTLYYLDPPARQYVLRVNQTNAAGVSSNAVVGVLQLGARQENKVFARRPDEETVYSLPPKDVARLPYAVWQLRDRRVWTFTTNQVGRVTVRRAGTSKTLQRNPNGSWTFAEGTVGIIDNYAPLEEMMFRLGELRASAWVAQGADRKASYGFTDANDQVTIELRGGDKPKTFVLEFGDKSKPSPNSLPYAMAVVDGQVYILEFPPALYFELLRGLFAPLFPAPAGAGP